jgi:C1A family cysteine protease
MVVGSYGAVGTNSETENDCECGNVTVKKSTTIDESLEYRTGLDLDEDWWVGAPFDPCEPSGSLPSRFDWCDPDYNYKGRNCVPPIRDQGNCGSCWAFATAGPLECKIKIEEQKTVDLSEQWLVSCNKDSWGCQGATKPNAFPYYNDKEGKCGHAGAVPESDFPYVANNVPCVGDYSHDYFIDDWSYIGNENSVPPVDSIKQAIYDYGPVSAAIAVNDAFAEYEDGIFKGPDSKEINHAIVLVGWQDREGLTPGHWILRNSWGTEWGEDGYMRIKYETSMVGYAAAYINNYSPAGLTSIGIMDLGPGNPGETVENSFELKYRGEGSINWEIDEYYVNTILTKWGDWTFTPLSGRLNDNEEQVINVKLIIKDSHGGGDHNLKLKIQNADNPSDFFYKEVYLHIKFDKQLPRSMMMFKFLENFPLLRLMLRQMELY